MLTKRACLDTVNPPGQIVNPPHLEVPLTRAVEAFRDEEIEGLVRRVRQLENELKYERSERTRLYLELEAKKQPKPARSVLQTFMQGKKA